jgi:hypothetical protein
VPAGISVKARLAVGRDFSQEIHTGVASCRRSAEKGDDGDGRSGAGHPPRLRSRGRTRPSPRVARDRRETGRVRAVSGRTAPGSRRCRAAPRRGPRLKNNRRSRKREE